MREYMSDEELLMFISDIEENDLVKAPPEIENKVFERIDKKNQLVEYRRFRNKVIAAVASIVVLTAFVPYNGEFLQDNLTIIHLKNERNATEKISDETGNGLFRDENGSILGNFGQSHYIGDLLNSRRED